jgi:hypothetical protein
MMFRNPTDGIAILALSVALGPAAYAAEDAPPAPEASPDVYKVLAENDQWRILEATWQPGKEDNLHSHPADRVSLFLTDCKLRLSKPDGTFRDATPKAGTAKARTGEPVKAHKAKNIGDKVCVMNIVELK